jgi:hypothetical protein
MYIYIFFSYNKKEILNITVDKIVCLQYNNLSDRVADTREDCDLKEEFCKEFLFYFWRRYYGTAISKL